VASWIIENSGTVLNADLSTFAPYNSHLEMIVFFKTLNSHIYAVQSQTQLSNQDLEKLSWLFSGAQPLTEQQLNSHFIGPRKEMISPWSTNAVEITQIMGIASILQNRRIHSN
jgi:phosphoribosylformylglycinamidine synthase